MDKFIGLKDSARTNQLDCIICYFSTVLYLMLHICVRRFDVTDTMHMFLGTKQASPVLRRRWKCLIRIRRQRLQQCLLQGQISNEKPWGSYLHTSRQPLDDTNPSLHSCPDHHHRHQKLLPRLVSMICVFSSVP